METKTKTHAAKNRILSVKLVRKGDYDADTSHLGAYSMRATSPYAIDRRHSEDCQSIAQSAKDAIETLERILQHINRERLRAGEDENNTEWESLDESFDCLVQLQNDLTECDCGGHNVSSRELPYFNPCDENYKGESEADIRKYCKQDYERMESLSRGDWGFLGIYAVAEVGVPRGAGGDLLTERLRSGGLWGIESDSDRSHFSEVEKEQLAELREVLESFGFSRRAIATAFKDVETVDE